VVKKTRQLAVITFRTFLGTNFQSSKNLSGFFSKIK